MKILFNVALVVAMGFSANASSITTEDDAKEIYYNLYNRICHEHLPEKIFEYMMDADNCIETFFKNSSMENKLSDEYKELSSQYVNMFCYFLRRDDVRQSVFFGYHNDLLKNILNFMRKKNLFDSMMFDPERSFDIITHFESILSEIYKNPEGCDDRLIKNFINEFKASRIRKNGQVYLKNDVNDILNHFCNDDFSSMIFPKIPGDSRKERKIIDTSYINNNSIFSKNRMVVNNDGYISDDFKPSTQFLKGKKITIPLALGGEGDPFSAEKFNCIPEKDQDKWGIIKNNYPSVIPQDGIPIGYTMYTPSESYLESNDISAVFIYAYGGLQMNEKHTIAEKNVKKVYALTQRLSEKGVLVVKLLLPNLLYLNKFQGSMNKDLHGCIHEAIHVAIQKLKDTTFSFHDSIPNELNVPFYIYGGSFGGRTAIKHSELYPDDIDGVISHDGSITIDDSRDYPDYLSVKSGIEKIKSKVLLVHTLGDCCVDPRESIVFYDALKRTNKKVRLFYSKKGNKSLYDENIQEKALYYKGHFIPNQENEFNAYIQNILNFMFDFESLSPKGSDLNRMHLDFLSSRIHPDRTLDEKFIAEGFCLYQEAVIDKYKINKTSNINAALVPEIEDGHNTLEKYFKNLYATLEFIKSPYNLKKHIQHQKNLVIATEENFNNAVNDFLSKLIYYVEDIMDIEISSIFELSDVSENLRAYIKNKIIQAGNENELFVNSFYMGNPFFIDNDNDNEYLFSKLINSIQRENNLRKKVTGMSFVDHLGSV